MRTYARNEIKFRKICHALQNLALLEVLVINLSSAGIITINHSEEIHDRTTDFELNKLFAFSPDFPVFIKSMTSLNRALASAFILQILVMRDFYMIIFVGLILFVYVYVISNYHYNCLGV